MAGRLETNLEEELKKELVRPEFMSKPDSEWTEEEQKAAKEFEKKQLKVSFVFLKFTPFNTSPLDGVNFKVDIRMNSCGAILGLYCNLRTTS